ncbi:MAG: monosaccharide transporter substrate-binding protein family [Microbacteriaceae bacterium]|nr:monosaccharide transporter substrate-binding protein family [Microbacteriaceae bacterium]
MRSTFRRRIAVLAAAGALTFSMAACSSTATSSSGDSQPKTIAFVSASMGVNYWQWVSGGVKERAKELGYKFVSYDSNNDQAKQLTNVKTAILAGASAIVLAPVSSASAAPVLAFAKQNHVPVAFAAIGPTSDQTDYTSAVTADNEATGVAEGKFICAAAKAKGSNKVGMLSIPQDRENAQKYLAGAKRSFAADGCDLVQMIQGKILTLGEAVQLANDLLTAHPDITGIYAMYDEAGTASAQALSERGLADKVAIAVADGSPTTVKLVRTGKIQALFLQEAAGQGYDATSQLANALKGQKTTKSIPLKQPMLTPSNIDTPALQVALKRVYPASAGAY